MTYREFIASKQVKVKPAGLAEIPWLSDALAPFQSDVVEFSLRAGRSAMFLDTGLGKTRCQVEWARQLPGKTLILAPLAVAAQTVREGRDALGVEIHHSRDGSVGEKLTIANYERLDLFKDAHFDGVVLDESSILKSFMGKTKQALCDRFKTTPFRLCCTATPAPNDYMELGNHSEFLGVMSGSEMLTRWFINDTMNFGNYRLKGHAERAFWQWVASWAACVSKPSDLGYDDGNYKLPALSTEIHSVESDYEVEAPEGMLFDVPTISAATLHKEKKRSIKHRVAEALKIVESEDEHFIIWCETNEESAALKHAMPYAVEVLGNHSPEYKEAATEWFCGYDTANLRLIGKAGELAACGNLNTRNVAASNTPPTKPSENAGSNKGGRQKKTASTCAATTPPTNPDSSEAQKSRQSTTQPVGLNTKATPASETSAGSKRKNGRPKIQPNEKPSDSASSESASQNGTSDSRAKMENAPSADQSQSGNSTLITAITQEECAAYSVVSATSESVSSRTPPSFSYQRRDIWKKRVLISKPSIFGYGMNFQHCARQIFASVSFSYEQFYQAARRSWRFGQKRPVRLDVILSPSEIPVWRTVQRKLEAHDRMKSAMRLAILGRGQEHTVKHDYNPTHLTTLPKWIFSKDSQSVPAPNATAAEKSKTRRKSARASGHSAKSAA